jgi:MtfA peptidase
MVSPFTDAADSGSRHFPAEWIADLERNVPAYLRLSAEQRERLQQRILAFLAEKHFEGCGGLELTDEIRVTIAAQACLLLLNLDARFSKLRSILVYPDTFVGRRTWIHEHFSGSDPSTATLGESWTQGAVVLSWSSVLAGAADPEDGSNVVLHEFAHQLDQEDGTANGIPLLRGRSAFGVWADVLRHEHAALEKAVERGDDTLLDGYGAKNRAEFFAVATEFFFERPRELSERHPAVYEQLRRFYGQDPAGVGAREVTSRATAGIGTERWGWRFYLQVGAILAAVAAFSIFMVHRQNPSTGPWLTPQPGVSIIGYPPPERCAVDLADGRVQGRVVAILGDGERVVGYRVQRNLGRPRQQPGGSLASHDVYAEAVNLVPCGSLPIQRNMPR